MFTLLELDGIQSLADAFGLAREEKGAGELLASFVDQTCITLSEHATGVVLEPDLGYAKVSSWLNNVPVVLALDEKKTEVDPLAIPALHKYWGVNEVHNNGAVAMLTLYYHPTEQVALEKKQFIAEISDYCRMLQTPFVLKLVIYTPAAEEFSVPSFQQAQLTAVQEFRSQVDMFVLQYPQDPLACATITTELDVPWLVSSDGLTYDQFKEVMRDSLDAGAQGVAVGNPLWAEISTLRQKDHSPDVVEIEKFIETTSRDRLIEVRRIVDEFGAQP
jgi:tagatose-1,6-bisphosphate aldolase